MFTNISRLMIVVLIVGLLQPHFVLAQSADTNLPTITSFSTDFLSVTSKDRYDTTIAIYGTNLGYLLDDGVELQLGPFVAHTVAGNSTGMNATFTIDYQELAKRNTTYTMTINNAGSTVTESNSGIQVFNPYKGKYKHQRVKQFLNRTPRKKAMTKRLVGMNIHWTLGGNSSIDDQYEAKLQSSNTVWAREHFSYKLIMGENEAAWLKRYDQTMLRYDSTNTKVVGMLAYGSADDEFAAPSAREWKNFVRKVVLRYRNYVDVWEIWNEPDSADYLSPNSWKNYKPLLKHGSSMIREYDPDAIILNGAIANISDEQYIRKLYKHGGQYFDELNVHLYYCDEFIDDGESVGRLQSDWERLEQIVEEYDPNEKIWVTELGCSTGQAGITDDIVKRYMKAAVKTLLAYEQNRPILLYTFRDRPYLEPYEAYFGFMTDDFATKPVWKWYRRLPAK